jgi:2'-hydroxyisoflavone reductase
MLAAIAAQVGPPGTRLTWVDSDFLRAEGLDGAALPLWAEGDHEAGNQMSADPAAAFAAGLSPRPLRESIADIAAEDRAPGSERPGVGITADREAEVLARWAAKTGQ